MSITEVDRQSTREATQVAAPPSWAIVLSALLVSIGIAWRSSASGQARSSISSAADRDNARPRDRNWDAVRTGNGERGRAAEAPTEIPWPGWKDILIRLYSRITRDRILLIAAGTTFYLILALFPGIAALVSIYGLFFDPKTMISHLDVVASVAPGGAVDILREQLTRLSQQSGASLSLGFVISLAVSLWSATSGVKALFDGLNVAYEEEEKRGFLRLTAIALVFTIGLIGFVLLSLAAVVALPVVLNFIPLPGIIKTTLSLARWPILFVVVALALSVFYRYGPSRAEPQWRWITWGSAAATLLWLAASILFSWYVANFGSYNKTYGSLGAIIGFMTWVWLSVTVILVGAQLNAEMEHQTARQSTSGPARALGERGVKMADTIGPPQS